MDLVGYVRVSTRGQAENGQGMEIQEAAIRGWCKENGHRLTAVYRDEGVSGATELDNRNGLSEGLASVKFNGADGLVVATIDRLARDAIIQEFILREIWQSGGTVFTVDDGEVRQNDPDNPSQALIRQVLGAVAEFERSMITLRLRRGRQRKHEQGGYAYGRVPYGYQSINGELVPEADEQQALDLMRDMRESGKSYREIASSLNDTGITAKSGGQWFPSTVRTVMLREVPA